MVDDVNDASVTIDWSGQSSTGETLNFSEWLTTTGPVQSGFLYISDWVGDATNGAGDLAEAVISIGNVGGASVGMNGFLWGLTDEIGFGGGTCYGAPCPFGYLVPFTLGQPFEVTGTIYLDPLFATDFSEVSAQFSIGAYTGIPNQYDTNVEITGSESVEVTSAPASTPEPRTALIAGLGLLLLVAGRRSVLSRERAKKVLANA